MYWKYSVEMFVKESKTWRTDFRYYMKEKSLSDFDLKDISGVRRNSKFIEITSTIP